MYRTLHRLADRLARIMALAGGLILVGLTALTCLSILGRAFVPLGIGPGPVPGIYEITEIGVAVAVFAFLPWTQLTRGHAAVDLLKPVFGGPLNRGLDLVIDLGMLAVALAGTWRLWLGMLDRIAYGDTTLILGWPLWPGYALALGGAGAFSLVAGFCVLRSGRALVGGGTDADDPGAGMP